LKDGNVPEMPFETSRASYTKGRKLGTLKTTMTPNRPMPVGRGQNPTPPPQTPPPHHRKEGGGKVRTGERTAYGEKTR